MASVEAREVFKGKVRNNDTTPQTMTLTFVPEIDHYKRPHNLEEHIRSYFEGINGINKRIIAEERKIIAQNRNTWPTLPVEERDRLLNDQMVSTEVRQKYNSKDEYWKNTTPWQPDQLMAPVINEPKLREESSESVSNDSFSTPFQWATKSQRNFQFPKVKREMLKNADVQEETEEPNEGAGEQDQTVKKINNVEKSLKEKQIKTKNENSKGNIGGSDLAVPGSSKEDDKARTSKSNIKSVESKDETPEQPKVDEKQYMDDSGTNNIFEFLQSWNP